MDISLKRLLPGEQLIQYGCTPGWVTLSRTKDGIYIVRMKGEKNPENRFIPPFIAAIMKAYDAVEQHLELHAGDSPAALLSISESVRFFSNGIDPTGAYSKKLNLPKMTAVEEAMHLALAMPSFSRPLQLPIPTIAVINGHAFGAGMMYTSCHDYRFQRIDRGYQCAIEVEIGIGIPPPEMEMFGHIMPKHAWQKTVMGAHRWGGDEAKREGFVTDTATLETIVDKAYKFAVKESKLAKGPRGRLVYMSIKNQVKGHVSKMVMDYNFPGGKMPKSMKSVPGLVASFYKKYPYFLRHINEEIDPLPGGQLIPPLDYGSGGSKL